MEKQIVSKAFLIFLIIVIVYAVFRVFQPFIDEILVATILVSVFYAPYEYLTKKFKEHKRLAALVMCILVALLVILPLVNFIAYAAQRSIDGYGRTVEYINNIQVDSSRYGNYLDRFNTLGIGKETVKDVAVDVVKKVNDWLVGGATSFIKSTTGFFISLVLIIFTMYFFFVDGKNMIEKIMYWTPFPNKYDKEIFKKFRDVSYSTMISTFVTAFIQGLIGAIGFFVVGLPAFFAGIAMGLLALLPYIGSAFVWFPSGIYLLVVGKIWQGIFLLAWGAGVVSTIDNIIRAYIIKGKAQVHPIFIIFSILGGIALFGFWGIIFGPLIISLAVTVLHIYELEYGKLLEK